MYYFLDVLEPIENKVQRHILTRLPDGGVMSFPLTDGNPNKVAYDAWLDEGNEPEEWTDAN